MNTLFAKARRNRRAIGASRRIMHTGVTMLGLLVGSALPAYAHGVAAGDLLAPPLFTAGAVGFAIYWAFLLWPAPHRQRGNVNQERPVPRAVE